MGILSLFRFVLVSFQTSFHWMVSLVCIGHLIAAYICLPSAIHSEIKWDWNLSANNFALVLVEFVSCRSLLFLQANNPRQINKAQPGVISNCQFYGPLHTHGSKSRARVGPNGWAQQWRQWPDSNAPGGIQTFGRGLVESGFYTHHTSVSLRSVIVFLVLLIFTEL